MLGKCFTSLQNATLQRCVASYIGHALIMTHCWVIGRGRHGMITRDFVLDMNGCLKVEIKDVFFGISEQNDSCLFPQTFEPDFFFCSKVGP